MLKRLFACLSGHTEPPTLATRCGHPCKPVDKLPSSGHELKVRVSPEHPQEWCHACLDKMSIKCAGCGESIEIGESISLYGIDDPSFTLPEGAVYHDPENKIMVGCTRWDCCESGAFYSGTWVPDESSTPEAPKGCVARVESPLEQCLRTGEVVIGNIP